jgi:large subunit ribosomal protein L5
MIEAATPKGSAKIPRLLETYRKTIAPTMAKEFNHSNALSVPRIEKVVVNMGVKEGAADIKIIEHLAKELSLITGQKVVVTRAKKSISTYKLRKGSQIGLKVTLRRYRMYEFLDRLLNVAMPRIRDFRGFPNSSFDDQANYSIGVQEQNIFPEIELDKVIKNQGMDITFVMSTDQKKEARRLLELLGFPFRKKGV